MAKSRLPAEKPKSQICPMPKLDKYKCEFLASEKHSQNSINSFLIESANINKTNKKRLRIKTNKASKFSLALSETLYLSSLILYKI